MRCLLFGIVLVIVSIGCSPTKPEAENGIPYNTVVGMTLYSKENVAGFLFTDQLLFWSHAIEKWQFYDDSIVVIATRYKPDSTLQALDQIKYVGEIDSKDRYWTDYGGDTWVTSKTTWKSYARSRISCGWTDVFSWCITDIDFFVRTGPSTSGYGMGKWYVYDNHVPSFALDLEPMELWYPENWVPGLCGFVQ